MYGRGILVLEWLNRVFSFPTIQTTFQVEHIGKASFNRLCSSNVTSAASGTLEHKLWPSKGQWMGFGWRLRYVVLTFLSFGKSDSRRCGSSTSAGRGILSEPLIFPELSISGPFRTSINVTDLHKGSWLVCVSNCSFR